MEVPFERRPTYVTRIWGLVTRAAVKGACCVGRNGIEALAERHLANAIHVGAAAPATSATLDTLNSDWSVVTGPILYPFHGNRHNLFTLHDKQRRQCQLPQTATTTKNTTNPPMLGTCIILDWLSILPPTPQGQPDLDERSRKRKRSLHSLSPNALRLSTRTP
ncbi:hypothetical protein CKAH01_16374 [Colletotrichum kahawae]|uniref:Uncharacterized protein n=1 Tax=Colletotrichum kahawae TaxID=34407 RepID=A0AAD9YDG7_COLKA|nr:hypothetical protein CKAH01_16374 [Colletotrichum kahawae]